MSKLLADEGADRAGGETRGPHLRIGKFGMKPPFEIYHNGMDIADANGHICTAENPEIARDLVMILNRVAEVAAFWTQFATLDFHINRIDPNDPSNRKERPEESDDTYRTEYGSRSL